tara:strand:+ start:2683 stop:3213 length:531 start_codon:yes stop_codon:yes gene_type:complete
MEIRNRESGAVTTVSQFKASYPNTSFPKQITADILDSYGYDAVLDGAQATVTAPYGVSTRDGVEQINGQWFTKFVAGPVFTDTTEETVDSEGNVTTTSYTAAQNEAAYRASVDATTAAAVRVARDKKLTDTDWTQMADSPLTSDKKTEWASYRTSLRDLPSASGFPHTMTWPTEPS